MKCLILAAGYATRMYPLTENFPKPLLPVKGRPILDWLIEDISACGINDFVVVTNHKFAGQFEDWAGQINNGTTGLENGLVNITVVDDGTSTNETRLGAVKDIQLGVSAESGFMFGDGAKVGDGLDSVAQDDYLVIAGDNLLDFSFKGFIEFFKEKKAPCVMTHEENDVEKQRRTAIITFDADGLITSYEEKPEEPKGNHAVPPFYCYRAEDLAGIGAALEDGCGYDAPGSFAAWLSGREKVYAWKMPGKRIDIGSLEGYEKIKNDFDIKIKHKVVSE